jgi:hypothetical protein
MTRPQNDPPVRCEKCGATHSVFADCDGPTHYTEGLGALADVYEGRLAEAFRSARARAENQWNVRPVKTVSARLDPKTALPAWSVPACLSKPDRPCRHNGIGACRRCAELPALEKPTIEVVATPSGPTFSVTIPLTRVADPDDGGDTMDTEIAALLQAVARDLLEPPFDPMAGEIQGETTVARYWVDGDDGP